MVTRGPRGRHATPPRGSLRSPERGAEPVVFRRVRWDLDREADGLDRLSEPDPEGCREALGKLVEGLDISSTGPSRREVVLLLADLLLEANWRVFRATGNTELFYAHRAWIVERFAGMEDAEEARREFMPALVRLLSPLKSVGRARAAVLVGRAKAWIENNFHRRISLSSVAEALHVSPTYLSRLFSRGTGRTLTHFIHEVRIDRARLLLMSGERSISEIAYLVGYQNYRDFYRRFVGLEKASPRAVRRRLPSGAAAAPPRRGDAR